MNVHSVLFITLASTGVVVILVGLLSLKYPPKKINDYYGYRTRNSMMTQERWDFAQPYSSKRMVQLGLLFVLTSIVSTFFEISTYAGLAIALGIIILSFGVLIRMIEKSIKEKFNKN